MESTIVHIPGPTEETRDRAIVARLRQLHSERKALIAQGQRHEALTNDAMAQRAIADVDSVDKPVPCRTADSAVRARSRQVLADLRARHNASQASTPKQSATPTPVPLRKTA